MVGTACSGSYGMCGNDLNNDGDDEFVMMYCCSGIWQTNPNNCPSCDNSECNSNTDSTRICKKTTNSGINFFVYQSCCLSPDGQEHRWISSGSCGDICINAAYWWSVPCSNEGSCSECNPETQIQIFQIQVVD